jgi:FeS assembly SUF system protein
MIPMDTPQKPRIGLPVTGEHTPSPPAAAPEIDPDAPLEDRVIAAIRSCYDPEIPVNIYDLGLIYELKIDGGNVRIRMTLTTPACPVAGSLPGEVKSRVLAVPGVTAADVELVWDPPWDKSRMSEEAALQLGFFD